VEKGANGANMKTHSVYLKMPAPNTARLLLTKFCPGIQDELLKMELLRLFPSFISQK
jgi:hypothetical protein